MSTSLAAAARLLRATGAITLALALNAAGSPAQLPVRVALDPGTQVRLTTDSAPHRRVVGRVASLRADTLRLQPHGGFGGAPAYPTASIRTLEIRGGEDKRRGILIGAGIGAGIVLVFGGMDHARGQISSNELLSTMVGNALIGGLIGYAFAPTGWERIPVPRS